MTVERKDGWVILAHSPTFREPMTIPYRVVLRAELKDGKVLKFVTHHQQRENDNGKPFVSYNNGHYFTHSEFGRAWQDFLERSAKQMEFCLPAPEGSGRAELKLY